MKKLITMPFLVLLLGVMLTACGTANQSNDTDNNKKEATADQNKENTKDEAAEDQTADESKETAAQTEDPSGQSNEDSKESSSKEITKEEDQSAVDSKATKESTTNNKDEVTKEGTYVGLADGHTIAVNIDGKEVAIQFGNTFSKQVNSLKEESKVKVTYTKDANGTLRLKTIESVKTK